MNATEREKQLARREGFIAGVKDVARRDLGWSACSPLGGENTLLIGGRSIEDVAASKYPLPKTPAPRVAIDADGDGWRWFDGRLQMRRLNREAWNEVALRDITDSSRAAVAKVLLDPTTWVEDPGPTPAAAAPPPIRHSGSCSKENVSLAYRDRVNCTCGAEKPTVHSHLCAGARSHDPSLCDCGVSTESGPQDLAKTREIL